MTGGNTSSTRIIAKNTFALYIRMFISMIVGLYTSRVVLNTLGVEDYGIYGVVGGVVAMLGFLNASMSGATSRFISFELGRKDYFRLKDTFSSAILIHIGIALLVFIIAETIGLWFLNNKLVIPPDRINAAQWVYQCSVLSTILGITQVPYNATIIAHEKMSAYAYIEIVNVTLKLLIVYLLTIGNFDKLKLYGILVFAVSVIVMVIYRMYCIRNFPESRFKLVYNKEIFQNILSYIKWEILGNMCITIRDNSANILVNLFFNVIYNAAISLATTINGLISAFSYNIITAFRPRIIKSYSTKNYSELQNYINNAIILSCLAFMIISIPCILETDTLIKLWLGEVPLYLISFIHIILFINFFKVINTILLIGIQSTGKIKKHSFTTGCLYIITIPTTFILFKNGFDALYSYISILLSVILVLIYSLYLLKRQIKEIQLSPVIISLIKITIIFTSSYIISKITHNSVSDNYLRLIYVTAICILSTCILTYTIILNKSQRLRLLNIISLNKH